MPAIAQRSRMSRQELLILHACTLHFTFMTAMNCIHANVRSSIPMLILASEVCRNKSIARPVSWLMRNSKAILSTRGSAIAGAKPAILRSQVVLAFHIQWRIRMTKLKLLSASTDRCRHARNSRHGSHEPCNLAAPRAGRQCERLPHRPFH